MKKLIVGLLIIVTSILLVGCKKEEVIEPYYNNDVYYNLFVRSFADSNGDGIGDLNGITENIDYFEELGITAIWLLPIFESNSYHGYDTIDYYNIDSDYGTMDDLTNLIEVASKKEIKIMLDLVINHTSDQHPWFIDAQKGSGSEYRDYYIWNGNTAYESFPGGLKDLNLDNPEVVKEVHNIVDYYMDLGVLGFRLDAVKHFFEQKLPSLAHTESMMFMNKLNNYVKEKNEKVFIVGEVLDNDYNMVSSYTRSQNSYFNFYARNEIINKAGHGSSSYLLSSNLEKMYNSYRENNPDFIDSPIIGNHDLDRVASIINNEDKLKLMNNIVMTLPGSPFIYYGDELKMKGSRSGSNGVTIDGVTYYDEFRRQPFIWGDSRTTSWLVDDGSNKDTKSYLQVKDDENSLFNSYKEIIKLRKEIPALMYGNEFYAYRKGDIQGYLRVINDGYYQEAVLVLHNLSNKVVNTEITLESLYNSSVLEAYETAVFRVNFNEIEDYKNVRN